MTAAADRIPCCIPFCRRTAPASRFPDCSEIICGKHWRLAPVADRRSHSKLRREVVRFEALYDRVEEAFPSPDIEREAFAALEAVDASWTTIRSQIIETAAGIR